MTDLSPSRTGLLAQTPWRSPGSRAHCFLTCLGSSTTPSLDATRDLTQRASLAFPQAPKGRHSDIHFRGSIPQPASTSVYASLSLLAETQARLEAGMKSLLLFRRALSSPTMCRFIPALGAPNLDEYNPFLCHLPTKRLICIALPQPRRLMKVKLQIPPRHAGTGRIRSVEKHPTGP
jgi:hypothetical protein